MKFGQQATVYKKISRRYARALFDQALTVDDVTRVELDMMLLADVIKNSEDFRDFLQAPHLPQEIYAVTFSELFKDKLQPVTFNFLLLLAQKSRLNILDDILAAFDDLFHVYHGVTKIQIISAVALESHHVDQICRKLKDRWQRAVFAQTSVDPSLIGGFKIKSGDKTLDLSLESQLDLFRRKVISH